MNLFDINRKRFDLFYKKLQSFTKVKKDLAEMSIAAERICDRGTWKGIKEFGRVLSIKEYFKKEKRRQSSAV